MLIPINAIHLSMRPLSAYTWYSSPRVVWIWLVPVGRRVLDVVLHDVMMPDKHTRHGADTTT